MSSNGLANMTLAELYELVAKYIDSDPIVAEYGIWFDSYGICSKVIDLQLIIINDKNILLSNDSMFRSEPHLTVIKLFDFLTGVLSKHPEYSYRYLWKELDNSSEALLDFRICPDEPFKAVI